MSLGKAAAAAFFFAGHAAVLVCFAVARYNDSMTTIRCLAVAIALGILLTLQPAVAADTPDSLEATRHLAQSGALQLALHHVDLLQPGDTAGSRWPEWQLLRLRLLAESGRHEELMRQVARSGTWNDSAHVEVQVLAAQSALALGRFAAVRDHAGRALWTTGISVAQIRQIRFLVIRSLILEGKGDDAYRNMLRFQQDYRPLNRATATQFVDGLLAVSRVKEALEWLGMIDERSATKLRLRLHTGLLPPADVVMEARAGIARSEDPAWWRVLLEAGDRLSDISLKIEALEQLLDRPDVPAADAARLWEVYLAYARNAANAHQLLAGDESSWLEFALKRKDAEPVVARAYLAYLAREGRSEPLRRTAQAQLASAFMAARLQRMALQLFGVWPGDPAALAEEARYQLGGAAEALQQHLRALQYQQGLPAPEGITAAVWDIRMAGLALRAGKRQVAAGIVRQLSATRTPIQAAEFPGWMSLVMQLADHGMADETQALAGRVMAAADPAQTQILLAATARAFDSGNQPLRAAEYHLRAALRAPDIDATADARLRAGLHLVRGGLHEDARVQFEWLLKNARNPAQIAVARRELGF